MNYHHLIFVSLKKSTHESGPGHIVFLHELYNIINLKEHLMYKIIINKIENIVNLFNNMKTYIQKNV